MIYGERKILVFVEYLIHMNDPGKQVPGSETASYKLRTCCPVVPHETHAYDISKFRSLIEA